MAKWLNCFINPLVPGMQDVKICQFIINCLPTVSFVKRLVCFNAHSQYSECQGHNGLTHSIHPTGHLWPPKLIYLIS